MTSWMVSMFSCPLTWRVVTWLVHWLLSENYKVTRATTQASPSGNRLILGWSTYPRGQQMCAIAPGAREQFFLGGGAKMLICLVITKIGGGTGISIPLRQKVGGGGNCPPCPPGSHAPVLPLLILVYQLYIGTAQKDCTSFWVKMLFCNMSVARIGAYPKKWYVSNFNYFKNKNY